jgi:hypothetical protein
MQFDTVGDKRHFPGRRGLAPNEHATDRQRQQLADRQNSPSHEAWVPLPIPRLWSGFEHRMQKEEGRMKSAAMARASGAIFIMFGRAPLGRMQKEE